MLHENVLFLQQTFKRKKNQPVETKPQFDEVSGETNKPVMENGDTDIMYPVMEW